MEVRQYNNGLRELRVFKGIQEGGARMSRLDENLELIKVTDKTTEMLKLASTEERESILKGINASILLDISRSLAVIADALRKDGVTS